MIACRFLLRVDVPRRLKKNCFNSKKSVSQLQWQSCTFHHVVNTKFRIEVVEVPGRDMDRKKRNKVSCVWRQVSTQTSASQGEIPQQDLMSDSENLQDVADAKKNEARNQGEEHDGVSSNVLTFQSENEFIVGDGKNLSVRSGEINDEFEVLQGAKITLDEKQVTSSKVTPSTAKHSSSIQVCSSLIRFIKGKEGATKRKVEDEMRVQIVLPSSKHEDSIIIEGESPESVARASEKILDIINEAVKSPSLDYSHFISLPLAIHPQLVDKLNRFQNSILGTSETDESKIPFSDSDEEVDAQHGDTAAEDAAQPKMEVVGEDVKAAEDATQPKMEDHSEDAKPDKDAVQLKMEDDSEDVKVDMKGISFVSYPPKKATTSALELRSNKASGSGIDRSIFIKPKTFHLTVLMLKLWNKDLVKAAAEVLQSVALKVIDALDGRPVSIRLKGLECMKGSFSKARVLYVPVEEIGSEERLLRACQVIIDAFVEAGLVIERDAKNKLKLHATVMNARHRKRKVKRRPNNFFDARSIADQYGSEDWGDYLIREAHLSERFVFDENGYYHCCASIPFPESMQVG